VWVTDNTSVTIVQQGWDGPFYRVRTEACVVSFMPGGRLCNVDVELRLADGSRWSATVFTLAEVDRVMRSWEASGEALGGRYF
jgi:hypothetical protein